jgi:hypothetical protein
VTFIEKISQKPLFVGVFGLIETISSNNKTNGDYMAKDLGGFEPMFGDQGSIRDQMFGRRAVQPPQYSTSETWSWNFNNPNNIQYNRTVSVTHTQIHDTWEEARASFKQDTRAWIREIEQRTGVRCPFLQETRRHPQPAKRPSLISRIVKALTA